MCTVIYWNNHLYSKAEKTEESEKKIEILEKAIDYYPSNDLVFYELGKAYFNLADNYLGSKARSEEYLRKSIKSFQKSLKSNPSSYFAHFHLAQSLLYLGYLYPSLNVSSHDEFKRAVSLGGENSQIFFEVSKIFLSQWSQLSDEDKDFTLQILKKIASRKDKEKILSLLHVWEMNVRNYGLIEKILPEDQHIYRMYADYLGERSLSLEARQRNLAKAEFLEFRRAKEKYKEGEKEFYSLRLEEAFNHFKSCLNILRRIKFYQNLVSQNLINSSEFNNLKKKALILLAKCVIERKKNLKEVEGYLLDYLSMEKDVEAIGEIEDYLKNRRLIREKFEISFNDNLDRLYFQLLLRFHQNHYRDIMQLGTHLKQSFIVVPEDKKNVYVCILDLIGDSYQKTNYLYDARDFYQKAFEIDSNNLETLIRIRQNYERLNADEEIRKASEKIDEMLSPREKLFKNYLMKKNKGYSWNPVLDGRKITLNLHFDFGERDIPPLISVFFNGRVVWEDYLKGKNLSLSLGTNIGRNSFKLIPLNRDIFLIKIAYHLKSSINDQE